MDGRLTVAQPKHSYPSSSWNRLPSASISSSSSAPSATARQITTSALPESPTTLPATPLDLTTFFLVPQQTSLFQAQLEQYNKLVSPGRGRGGLQAAPLPPVLSAPHVQAAPRSRSASKVSNKDKHLKPGIQSCHANKGTSHKTDRAVIMGKDSYNQHKLPLSSKFADMSHALPSKPPHPIRLPNGAAGQSSSVPSTPLQHARDSRDSFANNDRGFNLLSSRDPSPQNPSPRSAFSETIAGKKNSIVPIGCQYESPPQGLGRRRMPYSIGNDRLPRIDEAKVKVKLAEDEEKRLTAAIKVQYEKLLPTKPVEEKRQMLVQKLERYFNAQWPGHDIKVHLFGSSANLLCSDDSDGWYSSFQCLLPSDLGKV